MPFVEIELPKRPWVASDTAQERVMVRRGGATRECVFQTLNTSAVLGRLAGNITSVPLINSGGGTTAVADNIVLLNASGMIDSSFYTSGVGYALLAGRSGGQHLKGGTTASEDLILESTGHTTKGSVKVAGGSTFEVVSGNILVSEGDIYLTNENKIDYDGMGYNKYLASLNGILLYCKVPGGADAYRFNKDVIIVDDLLVDDNLQVNEEASGVYRSVTGYESKITKNAYALGTSATRGWVLKGPGSLRFLGVAFNVTTAQISDSWTISVRINGVLKMSVSIIPNPIGDKSGSLAVARGTATFADGDILSVYAGVTGLQTSVIADLFVNVNYQVD